MGVPLDNIERQVELLYEQYSAELLAYATALTGSRAPDDAVGQSEAARQILSMLSPRELECLCLRADGLSYDEAAEVLGVRPGTVSSLLTRVHRKLHGTVHDVQVGTLEALVAHASACAHSS